MKVVSKVSFFPPNPVEGGYYYNTIASTLGIYKEGNWSYHYPLVEANQKEGDLAFNINGYYPLYFTEDEAKDASSLSSAHSHEIDGVTYYMPDGGTEGKDFFHGTFGNTYYWYQRQGPLPSWITPPPQGATVTQALVTLTNPDTGETYTVPTGGYTVNVDAPDPGSAGSSDSGSAGSADDNSNQGALSPGDEDFTFIFSQSLDLSGYGEPPSYAYSISGDDRNGSFTIATSQSNPHTLELNVGDIVWFRMNAGSNSDTDQHPVTINHGASLSTAVSRAAEVGDQFIQFNEVGTFTYSCDIHSSMMGYINVSNPAATSNPAQPVSPPAAQPVSPPAATSSYVIDVSGDASVGYILSGDDANTTLSGSAYANPININVGDTIILNNSVSAAHPLNIRHQNDGYGNTVNNPEPSGQGTSQVTWTPTNPGVYQYQCTVHSSMVGNIVVS